MNCTIPGLNVKVLARAIQALAKIGDELFIEARSEKLTFLTFNQSKTVCGQYHLLDSFFSIYNIKESQLNENSAVSCKIHMKTILPLFKGTNLEKKLDFIKLEYESPKDTILFRVKYKTDDIIMSHILRLMDREILSIDDYSECRSNSITAGGAFYNNLLTLFSNSDDDITLEVSKNKMVARNYCVGVPHKPKSVRSQVNLNSSEFSLYKIRDETTISFCLKPFRTAILFAEVCNLNIGIDFDKGGRPLSISMRHPTFEVTFIVATANPYADGQSTISTASLPAKVTQVQAVDEGGDNNLRKSPDRDKKMISEINYTTWLESKRSTSKGPKKFVLEDEPAKDVSEIRSKADVDDDYVSKSPESPRTKKAKLIFKRSYDLTFHPSMKENVIVRDSDSE